MKPFEKKTRRIKLSFVKCSRILRKEEWAEVDEMAVAYEDNPSLVPTFHLLSSGGRFLVNKEEEMLPYFAVTNAGFFTIPAVVQTSFRRDHCVPISPQMELDGDALDDEDDQLIEI
jgi:hypothetical protein